MGNVFVCIQRFDKRGAFIKAVEPGKNFQIYERLFLSLEYVICITTHATFESTSSQGLLEFNWTEGYSSNPGLALAIVVQILGLFLCMVCLIGLLTYPFKRALKIS